MSFNLFICCPSFLVIESLKNLIYDVAEQMTHDGKPDGVKIMGEQIPWSYTVLEKELDDQQKQKLRNKEIPILNREEFLNVIRNIKCAKDIFDNEDIEAATTFLHNIGITF